MSFYEMMKNRQSCRSFDPEKRPTKDQLMRICEAGMLSPSACNTQPWRYVIVNDEELSPKTAKCTQDMKMNKFASDCPSFIIICEEPRRYSKKTRDWFVKYRYSEIDIGISTMNLCYAAREEGLETCILGWYNERAIKKILGLKSDKKIKLVLCVGYQKEGYKLRKKKRLPADKVITYMGEDNEL